MGFLYLEFGLVVVIIAHIIADVVSWPLILGLF